MLVLWDIDHTLVEVPNVTREAFDEGLQRTTGRPLIIMPDMTGRTDRAILRDLLALHTDKEPDKSLHQLAEAIGDAYHARAALVRTHGRVLAGAKECLAVLSSVVGVTQSILTGNMRRIAEVKLGELGLANELSWDAGAYGMDATERWNLVDIARSRAAASGTTIGDVVLVGDTARDVEAAVRTGARIVAVASGSTTAEELRSAGAEIILDALVDVDRVVDAIMTAAA